MAVEVVRAGCSTNSGRGVEVAHGDLAAFEGYRNHAHRVLNFARAISSFSAEET